MYTNRIAYPPIYKTWDDLYKKSTPVKSGMNYSDISLLLQTNQNNSMKKLMDPNTAHTFSLSANSANEIFTERSKPSVFDIISNQRKILFIYFCSNPKNVRNYPACLDDEEMMTPLVHIHPIILRYLSDEMREKDSIIAAAMSSTNGAYKQADWIHYILPTSERQGWISWAWSFVPSIKSPIQSIWKYVKSKNSEILSTYSKIRENTLKNQKMRISEGRVTQIIELGDINFVKNFDMDENSSISSNEQNIEDENEDACKTENKVEKE